jgi:hypothetical protein
MTQAFLKTFISALPIAGASELAQRSTLAGTLLVSLPLTSLFAIIRSWRDTPDSLRIVTFANDTLWWVPPSFLLFVVLPLMSRSGFGFTLSLCGGVLAPNAVHAAVVMLRGGTA